MQTAFRQQSKVLYNVAFCDIGGLRQHNAQKRCIRQARRLQHNYGAVQVVDDVGDPSSRIPFEQSDGVVRDGDRNAVRVGMQRQNKLPAVQMDTVRRAAP